MSPRPPPHARARAHLRKPEAALEPFELAADEAVVELDVVGREYAVAHEIHEAVSDRGASRTISLMMPVSCTILAGVDCCGSRSECHSPPASCSGLTWPLACRFANARTRSA